MQEDCSFNIAAIDNIVGTRITVIEPTSEDIFAISGLVISALRYERSKDTNLVLVVDLL